MIIERTRFMVRRHWIFAIVLGLGFVLRVITQVAYRPSILYIDSFRYLDNLTTLRPDQLNPIGYDLILNVFVWIGGTGLVVVVQHILGLGIGVAIYKLARRLGALRWMAALATLPILWDAYQLQIEQNVMSELWFEVILIAVLSLLIAKKGHRGPGWRAAGVVGLLLGFALLLRLIAVVLVLPVGIYLIVAGGAIPARQWRRIGARVLAAAVGFCVLIVPYATYFRTVTGHWGLTISSGNVLYGRAATVADCSKLDLRPVLRIYCPEEPLDDRLGVDNYAHADADPKWPGPLPPGSNRLKLASQFAREVIEQQPMAMFGAVFTDVAKSFAPVRKTYDKDVSITRWQFQFGYPTYGTAFPRPEPYAEKYDGMQPAVQPQLAWFLRAYQFHYGYTPGPALAIAGLLGLAAAVGIGRGRRSGLRSAAALAVGCGFILTLGSDAFEFSWRYQLPGLVLYPVAGVIGLTALVGRYRDRDQSSNTGNRSTP